MPDAGRGRGRTVLAVGVIAAVGLAVAAIPAVARGETVRSGDAPPAPDQLVVVAPASIVGPQATPIGIAPGREPVTVDVVFKPRPSSGLSEFVTAVSTRSSSVYGHFVTPSEFAARFGADAAAVASVRSVLSAGGLHPGTLDGDGLVLHVSGTVDALEHTFNTTLSEYRLPSGQVGYASRTPATLPAGPADLIAGIAGLDALPAQVAPSTMRERSVGAAGAATCPKAAKNNTDSLGYWTPTQIAQAYDMAPLDPGDAGAHERVGVVEHTGGFDPSDIAAYSARSCYDVVETDTAEKVRGVVQLHAVDGAPTASPNEETTADIEVLLGLAPSVGGVDVYVNPDTGNAGDVDTWAKAASADDPVVTDSAFANCENDVGLARAEAPLFEEMAAQGQSVFVASGDDGSEGYGCPKVDGVYPMNDPASQPDVTAVGGTDLTALGTPPPTIGQLPAQPPTETTWNDRTAEGCKPEPPTATPHCPVGFGGASGGGVSTVWPMPAYQQFWAGGPGPTNTGASCGNADGYCREVPDVSASADGYHGYPIFFEGAWQTGTVNHVNYSVGGTSLAAPTWAAMTALIDQQCGAPLGFLNPTLYSLAWSGAAPVYFNDVTGGQNDWTGHYGNAFAAGSGYDMATGVGSPIAANLASYLCSNSSWQYQGALHGDKANKTLFGSSAASRNGDDAVVGAPGQGGGAAYVIGVETSLAPVQTLTDPAGTNGDKFGYAVAEPDDEIVVGAPGSRNVYVYQEAAGEYSLIQTIAPPAGSSPAGKFGYSLAGSDSMLVIGDPTFGADGTGAAYVYVPNDTGTFLLRHTFAAPAGSGDGGDFGFAVAIDASTVPTVVAVGDPGLNRAAGATFPFSSTHASGASWKARPVLVASDGAPQSFFGTSVSAGAGFLVVGAPATVDGPAEAYAYSDDGLPAGGAPAQLLPSGSALWNSKPAPAGISVCVLTNVFGDLVGIAVGLPTLDQQHNGAAFVYGNNGGSAWTLEASLADPFNNGGDQFGSALALSNTGQLLVGLPGYTPEKPNDLHGDSGLVGIYGPRQFYP